MIDLDEATRALREESDGSSPTAPHTRARIMRSLHEKEHKRRVRWGFGIPLAVVFAGSTAFAGARGDLGETVQHAVSSVQGLFLSTNASDAAPSAAPRDTSAQATSTERIAPPPDAGKSLAEPTPAAPETPPHPSAALAPAPERERPAAESNAPHANEAAPSLEDPATIAALRLYRSAHEAQFVKTDCAAALTNYDAYLKAAPGDRLVPEARYNRALCLVQLGKRDAARDALTPFAEGRYGAFRQREARELLDALGR